MLAEPRARPAGNAGAGHEVIEAAPGKGAAVSASGDDGLPGRAVLDPAARDDHGSASAVADRTRAGRPAMLPMAHVEARRTRQPAPEGSDTVRPLRPHLLRPPRVFGDASMVRLNCNGECPCKNTLRASAAWRSPPL